MSLQPLARCALAATVTLAVAACASTRLPAPAPTPAATPAAAGVAVDVPDIRHPEGESASWWFRDGAAQAAANGAMQGTARNVILFVGDGMSLPTVAAARILQGQLRGEPGEENRLVWEHFPATALSKTYNTDQQTPDSAGTMSAMATGAKTRAGLISVDQSMYFGDCTGLDEGRLSTLWEQAADAGMATGIVTTTRLTHATPASTLAHSPNRNWENDTQVPAEAKALGCTDIARQIVENPHGNGPLVMLGGGRAHFMPSDQVDPEYPDRTGQRGDGRDLVALWQQRHPQGAYVWNAEQLAAAPTDAPLLGLFEPGHMQYEHDRPRDPAGEPSLAEMTRAAISRLAAAPEGFVLLVEGGRIDHAHHGGNAYRALTDTLALSDAVQAALDMTSREDTLILVTADHAHTMSFVGYPGRGNPILGTVAKTDRDGNVEQATDRDGLPYTTLVYANGPGYVGDDGRPDLSGVDTTGPDYLQEATVPMGSETHGGDDVGIWAIGPGSHAIRGSVEQNAIYHFMLQSTPYLREAFCATGGCNADGVPVELPRP